ncbi:MAG: ExbD/TolR family protein [Phycisphaerales bacterium JB038]
MSSRRQKGPARIEANLTAFIDVTFLLIIFFILVAQISSSERPNLPLPQVEDRASSPLERGERLVINCAHRGEGALYTIGTTSFAGESGLRQLRERVRAWCDSQSEEPLAVRAERTLPYEHIDPLLELLREARVTEVELVVVPPEDGSF